MNAGYPTCTLGPKISCSSHCMYENLLHRDAHTGELSPMLAERWEVMDGGRAWKFYLRRGG
jgi:ABC-type transport system substrate-binding protein